MLTIGNLLLELRNIACKILSLFVPAIYATLSTGLKVRRRQCISAYKLPP